MLNASDSPLTFGQIHDTRQHDGLGGRSDLRPRPLRGTSPRPVYWQKSHAPVDVWVSPSSQAPVVWSWTQPMPATRASVVQSLPLAQGSVPASAHRRHRPRRGRRARRAARPGPRRRPSPAEARAPRVLRCSSPGGRPTAGRARPGLAMDGCVAAWLARACRGGSARRRACPVTTRGWGRAWTLTAVPGAPPSRDGQPSVSKAQRAGRSRAVGSPRQPRHGTVSWRQA